MLVYTCVAKLMMHENKEGEKERKTGFGKKRIQIRTKGGIQIREKAS
jgi:hypothetical protein